MAFFLLLWLLNVTTDVQRKGIADYFAPANISKSESGAGGMIGGQTINAPGAEISDKSQPSVQDVTISTVGKGEEGDEDTQGMSEGEGKATEGPNAKTPNNQGSAQTGNITLSKDEQAMALSMRNENRVSSRPSKP